MKYLVPNFYLANLEKKIEAVSKKCKLCGCPITFAITDETDFVTYYDDKTMEKKVFAATYVEVEGVAKINGWTFVARIEHTENGNVIFCAPNQTCPEKYREAKPYCDHCHTLRDRKDTFVIVNENGEYKQVGRSCLKLYTNGLDAEMCAQFAEMVYMLGEDWKSYAETVEPSFACFRTVELVAIAYSIVQSDGYNREAIDRDVFDILNNKDLRRSTYHLYEKQAESVIEYASSIEETSDYLHNVKVYFGLEYIERVHVRLIASFVNVYIKEQARALRLKKLACSQHIGEVGQRIVINVNVKDGEAFRVLYTKAGYTYSSPDTYVVEFLDTDGNVYKWSTANYFDLKEQAREIGNGSLQIKATVKEHSEYKGVKQTVVTRCALA